MASASSGQTFRTASGQITHDEGGKVLLGRPSGTRERHMGIRFRSADVRKPLVSVAEMVDAGYDVTFSEKHGKDHSHAVHRAAGSVVPFVRTGMVFEIEWGLAEATDLCP